MRVSETVVIEVEGQPSVPARQYEACLTHKQGWDCRLLYRGKQVWHAMNWPDRAELLELARERAESHTRKHWRDG